MKIKTTLLGMFFKQAIPVTLIMLPIGCLYVLLVRKPLSWQDPWLALFVILHSIGIAACLGRFRSPAFAFIYTRGYSRDALWSYKMLSTVLSFISVWLPMALIVWLSIRCALQDKIFKSPYFPIMSMREVSVPWIWLIGYVLLLSLFHYVWIRRAQPMRGGNDVIFLAVGVVIAMIVIMPFSWHPQWFRMLIYILSAVIVIVTLVAGWRLHRTMEVYQ